MPSYLVSLNLALRVILKVSVSLESALYDFSKLFSKGVVVEQVVDAQAGAGCLGGVGGSDSFLGRADGGTSQLDFFESVNNLVEIKHEMGAIGDKEAVGAVEAFGF